MMVCTELVGKLILVDETLLGHLGSVRAQMWCHEPNRIKSFLEVYPHTLVFHIKLQVEVTDDGSIPKSVSSHKLDG